MAFWIYLQTLDLYALALNLNRDTKQTTSNTVQMCRPCHTRHDKPERTHCVDMLCLHPALRTKFLPDDRLQGCDQSTFQCQIAMQKLFAVPLQFLSMRPKNPSPSIAAF